MYSYQHIYINQLPISCPWVSLKSCKFPLPMLCPCRHYMIPYKKPLVWCICNVTICYCPSYFNSVLSLSDLRREWCAVTRMLHVIAQSIAQGQSNLKLELYTKGIYLRGFFFISTYFVRNPLCRHLKYCPLLKHFRLQIDAYYTMKSYKIN